MGQALSLSNILCVAVRVYDHIHPKFRASYTNRCNGFRTVFDRYGGDEQFDAVTFWKK